MADNFSFPISGLSLLIVKATLVNVHLIRRSRPKVFAAPHSKGSEQGSSGQGG
jgi:hypothetical protein